MSTPKPNMRYGEVLDWLEEFGITRFAGRRLIELKVIKGFQIGGQGPTYYSRAQVQSDVIDKTNPAEGPASEANGKRVAQ